jgi:ABC-2 type transport system permease protein
MTVTISPIAIMLLFVFVLGGAIQIDTDNYVNYLLPGILLMTIANGIGYVSYRLFLDMQRGIFERFHSMPIARSAALWGHVLVSLVSNAISVAVIILIAFIIGFRSPAGLSSWLAVVGILGLFTLALTWIAVIAGLYAKSADSAGAFAFIIHLLPFISSAFVPTDTMPKALRIFAENQPVTSIVNALRALLNNQPIGNEIWIALAWCAGIMIVAYTFAIRTYKKRL